MPPHPPPAAAGEKQATAEEGPSFGARGIRQDTWGCGKQIHGGSRLGWGLREAERRKWPWAKGGWVQSSGMGSWASGGDSVHR